MLVHGWTNIKIIFGSNNSNLNARVEQRVLGYPAALSANVSVIIQYASLHWELSIFFVALPVTELFQLTEFYPKCHDFYTTNIITHYNTSPNAHPPHNKWIDD